MPRGIATRSAIHKGLQRTKRAPDLSYASRPRRDQPQQDDKSYGEEGHDRWQARDEHRGQRPFGPEAEASWRRVMPYEDVKSNTMRRPRPRRDFAEQGGREQEPRSLPYTTPASQFLYGTNVVEAALKSDRRKLYNLYLARSPEGETDEKKRRVRALAKARNIPIRYLSSGTHLLNEQSRGHPHNGVLLEASPLKQPHAKWLLQSQGIDHAELGYARGPESSEDFAVNGEDEPIPVHSDQPRHPLVLLFDGVQDTGNMGGMLRTAHFLGVDAVVMSSTCAPLGANTLKAAAGAAEFQNLLMVKDTDGFVKQSKANGWKFFAAVPPPKFRRGESSHMTMENMKSPLSRSPCVLMIGGEGPGLMPDMIQKADCTISIPSHRTSQSSVDSLNASVATALLANAFLNDLHSTNRPTDAEQKTLKLF